MNKETSAVLPTEAAHIICKVAELLGMGGTDIEVVYQIDDWWFVPRCEQGKEHWRKRMPQTVSLYQETGMLPAYFREAFEFLVSDRHKELLEKIAIAEAEMPSPSKALAA